MTTSESPSMALPVLPYSQTIRVIPTQAELRIQPTHLQKHRVSITFTIFCVIMTIIDSCSPSPALHVDVKSVVTYKAALLAVG